MKKNLYFFLAILLFGMMSLKVSASGSVGESTTTDGSGNVYVTGVFDSPTITFGTISLSNTTGNGDMYIVKYSPSGTVLWAKSAGGNGNDIGSNVAADGSGNVYVTGNFVSSSITFGTITLTNAGGGYGDMFIVKYDGTNGNAIWAQSAGGSNHDLGFSIAIDGNGNVYVTGEFSSSSITFGTTTPLINAASGTYDILLVKYDAGGTVLSASSAGGSGDDGGSGLATDGSSNVFMTGEFTSSSITFGSTTLTNAGINSFFLVKYDASGAVSWATSAGGGSGYKVAVDGSRNVYVSGNFDSSFITFGATTLTNAGNNDMFIVKYDGTSGNALWANRAGGSGNDQGRGIATDGNGNVYMTGYFYSSSIIFGTTALTNATSGFEDLYIVKYDAASGNALWAKRTGGTLNDNGLGIAIYGSGNVYVTGQFSSSSITFGTTTLSLCNSCHPVACWSHDMYIAKYDASGNVSWAKSGGVALCSKNHRSADDGIDGIVDELSNEITIFPNPSSGRFIFSTAGSQSGINNISVFNIVGEEMPTQKFMGNAEQIELNMTSLPKGMYIARIVVGNDVYNKRILVE